MPEPAPALKEIFNLDMLRHIGDEMKTVCSTFDAERFVVAAAKDLDQLGIMQRMRRVATSLHETLPGDFTENLRHLYALVPRIGHNFVAISLSEYVALYGRGDFQQSMDALRYFTRFGSSEFAIRQFLRDDLTGTLSVMREWARDENEHVRRLASEGCRPRLPWSFQLTELLQDPEPVAPILAELKGDNSLYVRKSVANHLNDITKDNPDWVLKRLSDWPMGDRHTAWIARQALRTLVKKGDRRALSLLGAGDAPEVSVTRFATTPSRLALGERLTLSSAIISTSPGPQRLVIDYAIHYVKKTEGAGRKVFKWKEADLAAGQRLDLTISQTIRDFTTRRHNAGHHGVELLVNGQVLATTGFDLMIETGEANAQT